MIDRRTIWAGLAASVLSARGDVAVAMPRGRLRPSGDAWVHVQQLPPGIGPLPPEVSKDPKALDQYLKEGVYNRIAKAGVSIEDDARPEIDKAIERSAEAATRDKRGELGKGQNLDALPVEVRRVVVLRNLNTFVDVLLVVALNEGRKITRQIVNRVQGYLCPLYPICTG